MAKQLKNCIMQSGMIPGAATLVLLFCRGAPVPAMAALRTAEPPRPAEEKNCREISAALY